MPKIELETMSLNELRNLRAELDKSIETYERRKKADALAAVEAKAKEFGFSLAELMGSKPRRRSNTPSIARYQHPENPAVTWTGHGRRPAWINEGLAAGKAIEDFNRHSPSGLPTDVKIA